MQAYPAFAPIPSPNTYPTGSSDSGTLTLIPQVTGAGEQQTAASCSHPPMPQPCLGERRFSCVAVRHHSVGHQPSSHMSHSRTHAVTP